MDINATFIGQIIVFLIMLWFIAKVVVPMIATPINERYRKIADGLAAGEAGQKQLLQASADADQILREARERASEALRREFGTLVVQAASTLVEHEVDPATHAKLLKRLTDDIARG